MGHIQEYKLLLCVYCVRVDSVPVQDYKLLTFANINSLHCPPGLSSTPYCSKQWTMACNMKKSVYCAQTDSVHVQDYKFLTFANIPPPAPTPWVEQHTLLQQAVDSYLQQQSHCLNNNISSSRLKSLILASNDT